MKTKKFCDFLKNIIDYGICIYLVLILAVMPFYNREGYSHIGTDKAFFFNNVAVRMGRLLLPAAAAYFAVWAVNCRKNIRQELCGRISLTDLFAGGYGIILLLSCFCSAYRETALWGASGWYMGLWPQLALVMTYFLVSKLWKPRRWMMYMTLVSSALVFLLGFLNRMRLDPLGMGLSNSNFISTVGNINWYCGYLTSVFFAGAALMWQGQNQKWWKKGLLALYVAVGFASLLTQGSDSGFVALAAAAAAMFVLSAADSGRMLMFWWEMLLLGCAAVSVGVIRTVFPEVLSYGGGYGRWLSSGWRPCFMTIVSVTALLLTYLSRKKGIYPEKVLRVVSKVFLGAVLASMAVLIGAITVNTLRPGSLGPWSELPLFNFSEKWGSSRGATWKAGWMCFAEQGFLHKLVGVGPDCMSAYLYEAGSMELKELTKNTFGGQVLTNAHCEWLTVLVNTGILGLTAFAGMMLTGIRRFLKEAGTDRFACACGFCLLAYTANNLFSFQQSMNVAALFVLFGMGGAFLRKEGDADVSRG